MKVRLFAEDMNLNKKDEKYVEIQKYDLLGHKTATKRRQLFSSLNGL